MPTQPRRLKDLFIAALDLADATERAAFLDRECASDPEMRHRLDVLLRAHDDPASAVDGPLLTPPAKSDTGDYTPAGPPTGSLYGPDATDHHSPQLDTGTIIAGKYKLFELIGEGGMGSVWMAQQTEPVKRAVAVKLIKPGMDSRAVLARFDAERQALAVMDHPNIARVLDGGATADGRPFFVMELVKGVPITQFCDARKLTPRQRLELFVPVCQAIQHAHQKGVIHRDIKPSNVLIALYDDRPVPKVIDFGVAKATGAALTDHTLMTGFGAVVGTPEYMSPEQASLNNLDIDTRSDVYSLGVLLYELLTGTTPVDRKSLGKAAILEVLRIVREVEAPRPSAKLSSSGTLPSVAANRSTEPARLSVLLKRDLDWVVLKAVEKDRARRYESANGLAADVQRYLAGEAVQAHPPSTSYRLRKFARKNRVVLAMGTLVISIFILGAAGTIWQVAERQRERAVSATRTRETISATLDQAEAALRADHPADAEVALAAAERGLDGVETLDLRSRFVAMRKDLAMVCRLNGVLERVWSFSISTSKGIDTDRGAALYRAAFEEYGYSAGDVPLGERAAVILASPISAKLISGLWDWFFLAPKTPGLRAVLDAADPDPFRATVREALVAGDEAHVSRLALATDVAVAPPGFAVALGTHLASKDPDAGLRLLKAAWLNHPDYYPLARQIGFIVYSRNLPDESVQWFRLALGIRPDAEAYANLGVSLFSNQPNKKTDLLECEGAIRKAIKLGLDDTIHLVILGLVLEHRDDLSGAELAFQRAVALHPKDSAARIGMMVVHHRRKDWDGLIRVLEEFDDVQDDGRGRLDNAYLAGYLQGLMLGMTWALPTTVGATRPWLVVSYYMKKESRVSRTSSADPKQPPDDLRYNAACLAILVSSGRTADAPPVPEWPAVRRKGLEWLSADLSHWKVCVSTDPAANRESAHNAMNFWLADTDLASARDDSELAKLQPDEQANWRAFWTEVRSLRDRTRPPERAPAPREVKR